MGIWAGIKYALNSTLGTSNFKPLDQLLDDKISGALAGYSCVRHIQQGRLAEIEGKRTVSLSGFQNFSKMVAFVSGGGSDYDNGDKKIVVPYISNFSLTSLTISCESFDGRANFHASAYYTVIEFY